MRRVERWRRVARVVLSDDATRSMLEPFIADYLAERERNPDVDQTIGREALRLILAAWWSERGEAVARARWTWMLSVVALGVVALPFVPDHRAGQLINVVISAACALLVLASSVSFVRRVGRVAPLGLLAVVVLLSLFGLEHEGRRIWLAAGPIPLQLGLLALPLVVLSLAQGGWRRLSAVALYAVAMVVLGDGVAAMTCAIALLVALLVATVCRRASAVLPAASAMGMALGPAVLGEPLVLVTYGGSATLALLATVALAAHAQHRPPMPAR